MARYAREHVRHQCVLSPKRHHRRAARSRRAPRAQRRERQSCSKPPRKNGGCVPNRQELRDQLSIEEDRRIAAQSRADMDFLAREIASLRMRVGEVATRDFVRAELRDLLEELDRRADEEEPERLETAGPAFVAPRAPDAG